MVFPGQVEGVGAIPPDVAARLVANAELLLLFPVACAGLLWLLRYETGIPLKIGAMLVPPVTAAGFGIAFWIHLDVGVTVLQALGILCAALIPVLVAFDIVFTRRSPVRQGPPSRRD